MDDLKKRIERLETHAAISTLIHWATAATAGFLLKEYFGG